jgi:hypothetical protein
MVGGEDAIVLASCVAGSGDPKEALTGAALTMPLLPDLRPPHDHGVTMLGVETRVSQADVQC